MKTDHPHDKRVGRPPGDAYASVHAIQKDGLHSPRPFPRQELPSRTIEVEKKYVAAGCKAAVWILHGSTGRVGAFERLFQTLDGSIRMPSTHSIVGLAFLDNAFICGKAS